MSTQVTHIRDSVGFAAALTGRFPGVLDVSRETVGRLDVYAQLLARWQKTINLVAPSTLGDIWHRHFADSAQVAGLALERGPQGPLKWVDLGTGAGFPGLVVGILLAEVRPGSKLVLLESDQRKCAFLREVVRETGIAGSVTVDIVAGRIESPANQSRVGIVDVVSARVLAPLEKLVALVAPFCGPSTLCTLLKGRDVVVEVEAASGLGFGFELVPSLTDADARVVLARRDR
jgi:16S rRNA (guanine527-N7)-methyltransferase